ncbi:PAS domain-containing protein [Deinococcus peraridilitoris]|uniref:PAS domain-containing protein n=1 Tax=Deinococcus peraridilitoris TaxID=432329 RepID=UPI0002EAB727|nr:PAS domain-containing protein [Deinococcus peraridilitoris]
MISAEALAEAINDGFVNVDGEWRVTYLSRRARLMLRQLENAAPLQLQDLIPNEPTSPAWRELCRAMQQRVQVEFDVFYPAFFTWHEVRAVPSGDGLSLILRDITDRQWLLRKEAERAYLRDLFTAVPVALSITRGPEHRFEFVNEFARSLIGGRDVEGFALREAFPDLHGQGFFEIFDHVYNTGEAVHFSERPALLTDPTTGETRQLYVNASYQALRGFDAQVSGILSMSVDVTAYVEARQRSDELAQERTAVLDHLQEGVIVADSAGRIIFINEVAARLHGLSQLDVTPAEYTQTYNRLTIDGEPHPIDRLPMVRAVQYDEVVRGARWRVRRPDGDVVLLEGDANPVYGPEGTKTGAVLTMREVRR